MLCCLLFQFLVVLHNGSCLSHTPAACARDMIRNSSVPVSAFLVSESDLALYLRLHSVHEPLSHFSVRTCKLLGICSAAVEYCRILQSIILEHSTRLVECIVERRRVSRVSLSTSVQGENFLFFVACSCCPFVEACSVRSDTKSHFAEKHILDPGQPSFACQLCAYQGGKSSKGWPDGC